VKNKGAEEEKLWAKLWLWENDLYFGGMMSSWMQLESKVHVEEWWEIKLERHGDLILEGPKYYVKYLDFI
jgi:hypothetical protein